MEWTRKTRSPPADPVVVWKKRNAENSRGKWNQKSCKLAQLEQLEGKEERENSFLDRVDYLEIKSIEFLFVQKSDSIFILKINIPKKFMSF